MNMDAGHVFANVFVGGERVHILSQSWWRTCIVNFVCISQIIFNLSQQFVPIIGLLFMQKFMRPKCGAAETNGRREYGRRVTYYVAFVNGSGVRGASKSIIRRWEHTCEVRDRQTLPPGHNCKFNETETPLKSIHIVNTLTFMPDERHPPHTFLTQKTRVTAKRTMIIGIRCECVLLLVDSWRKFCIA